MTDPRPTSCVAATPSGPRRHLVARWLALVVLGLASACAFADSTSPRMAAMVLRLVAPGGRNAGTVIPDSVVLTVTGPGIGTPITTSVVFDSTGTATATMSIPVGSNRVLQLDMYKGGLLIFSGTSTFSVSAGSNPPAQVTPTPVTNTTLLDILPVSPQAVPDSAVLSISGVGITTPIAASARYVGGVAHFSLALPVGTARTVRVDQYVAGQIVLSGTGTFDVGPGTNALQVVTPATSSSPMALNIVIPGGVVAGLTIPDSAVVTVTGFGIATPIRSAAPFNTSGVAAASINIPVGVNRQLKVDMYLSGALVYSGTSAVSVVTGTNPTQQISPTPITGTVPIQVTVGSFIVQVAPTTATVAVGQTTTLTATVRDGNGNIATGVAARWATSNPAIAVVDSITGVVTGVRTGSTQITATAVGQAAAATVTVP